MVTLVATGWVSVRVIRLERQRIEEAQHTKVEENVSLALWRIDSLVAPLVAIENARPFQEYSLTRSHNPMVKKKGPHLENHYFTMELFFDNSKFVRQIRPVHGDVPSALRKTSKVSQLVTKLPKPTIQLSKPATMQFASKSWDDAIQAPNSPGIDMSNMNMPAINKTVGKGATRSGLEYQARQSTLNRAMSNIAPVLSQSSAQTPAPMQQAVPRPEPDTGSQSELQTAQAPIPQQALQVANEHAQVPESNDAWAPMRPVCVGDQLLLLRQVRFGGHWFLQGCLLDWSRLAPFLEKEVTDLLPDARLVLDDHQNAGGRMLASLPVRLEPGPLPASERESIETTLTPVLASVAIAFGCVLLSIGAFAVLLLGMLRLGRRRTEFVTAVTHELRTPLTTFRMYSEMLAEGMVQPESQKSYLQTLESEADRLTHLVENVLSSARLERGRHAGRIETLSLNELIAPIASRIAKRCQRAQMQLDVQMDDQAGGTTVRTNPSAVEQILWNLVDNACKYAASAENRTILVLCETQGENVTIAVSDQGPGLAREVRRRLFHGFSKTASEAARSAPGVGLGLALSRRLACDLGGDLTFIPTEQGACFRLTLVAKRETNRTE